MLENDGIDAKYGFERIRDNSERTGFLLNMHSVPHNVNLVIRVSNFVFID